MANKIFLDTNILIDYTLQRKGELNEIERIFNLAEENKIDLHISESVFATTIYYLQKNKLNTLGIIRELSKVLTFIPFKKEIISHPLERFKDVEGGILYFLAFKARMQYFITRNVKGFKFTLPSLPVFTPSKILKDYFS